MKKLVLGIIPDDFSAETHIAFGPWCFLGKEDAYANWDKLVFLDAPFDSVEQLSHSSQLTCNYANSLIPLLAERLNSQYKVALSNNFWRTLLMPWLLTLVQVLWDRQCRVKKLLDLYKDEAISVDLVSDEVHWEFQDTADFVEGGVFSPEYNEWLFSRLLDGSLPEKWQINWKTTSRHMPLVSPKPQIAIKETLVKVLKLLSPRCRGVYGIGPFASIFWSLLLTIKPNKKIASSESISLDDNTECSLDWLPFNVFRIIYMSMPLCFTTLHLPYSKKWGCVGKYRLLGPLLWYDEQEKVRIACALEAGENLIITQHGCNYGSAKLLPLVAETEYLHNYFITWGWKEQNEYRGNFVALPSPYVTSFARKRKQRSNDLVVVGTRANLFSYRFDSLPQPNEQLAYRMNKRNFFELLKSDVFQNVLYRPYFNENGSLSDCSYFLSSFHNLRICHGDLHRQIALCKLLVIDNPGTTLNLALAANIPVVGFWNKKAFSMCHQAESFFGALNDAGVLYEDGKSAADKVNQIWDNVENWWNQPAIQSARKAWCHEYARIDRFWWRKWGSFIWNV